MVAQLAQEMQMHLPLPLETASALPRPGWRKEGKERKGKGRLQREIRYLDEEDGLMKIWG
jgi:hypothetical protein